MTSSLENLLANVKPEEFSQSQKVLLRFTT